MSVAALATLVTTRPPSSSSRRWTPLVLLALAGALLLPTSAQGTIEAASPTGRTPTLFWTSPRQSVWNRMRAENHPWWRQLQSNADRSGTESARYGDFGQWATLAYQVTGSQTYAQKAWSQLNTTANGGPYITAAGAPGGNRNFTRENFIDFVWMYDWLYPALTPAQRKAYVDTLNHWADCVLGELWTPRLSDSDETTGHYFGLALLDLATAPDNPRAGSYLKLPITGGLRSTSVDMGSTMRNAVRAYVETARGGAWCESAEYNLGTLRLLFQGAEAVRTATGGEDYFPEVTALAREVAVSLLHDLTPDLRQSYQWGDIQELRSQFLRRRINLAGVLAGLLQDDPETGPALRQLVDDLSAIYGISGYESAEPSPSFYLFCNPYSAKVDWRANLPKGHFAPGQGLLFFHDRWTPAGSLFGAHMSERVHVDHEIAHFGNFQLYRKGEWALTHPLSYGATQAEYANSMLFGGLSAMAQRGAVAAELAGDDSYAYLAGTTWGSYYEPNYWDAPPPFLNEWTRSAVYLPSRDGKSDTIVLFDRTNSLDPKALPKVERYRAPDRARIQSAPAVKQWLIHSPVAPTLTADAIAWKSDGGQQLRVNTLLPAAQSRTVIDEAQAWPDTYGYPVPGEQKFQTRIVPKSTAQWDTFLNVVQVSDAGVTLKNTTVRSAGGEVEGALVQRAGHADTLLLFGAKPGSRTVTAGYTVSWTSTAARTETLLFDLPASTHSSALLDGKNISLPISDQGVARLTVSSAGAHTLRLGSGDDGSGTQDKTPPRVPSSLKLSPGDAQIAASWSPVTDNDLAGYNLYRAASQSGPFQKQNAAPLTATSFTQSGLTNGAEYWYAVTAIDDAGNESGRSAAQNATPKAPESPRYSLAGRVLCDGAGVAGVEVRTGSYSVITSADGRYAIDGLPEGSYTVRASVSGYSISATQTFRVGPSRGDVNFTASRQPGSEPYFRAINLGGESVVIEGKTWLSMTEARSQGLRVNNAVTSVAKASDSLRPDVTPEQASMLLSSLKAKKRGLSLKQTLPNGRYVVWLWVLETEKTNSHCLTLKIEGAPLARKLGRLTKNRWARYGSYPVTVTDGSLDLELIGKGCPATLSGVIISGAP